MATVLEIQDGGDRHLEFFQICYRRYRYVPNRSPNVSTNFGDDWSNTKEMTAVFQNPRCGSRHLEKDNSS